MLKECKLWSIFLFYKLFLIKIEEMCHLYKRICMDVTARRCLLLKKLIILRQGLLFACRIPLAEQILLAIQEMLQTQSFCGGALVNPLVISTTGVTRGAHSCLFLATLSMARGLGMRLSVGGWDQTALPTYTGDLLPFNYPKKIK